MRKIVAVFLLFVSFNLFAEKHEIGRLIVEIRDYGITSKSPEWAFPAYSGTKVLTQYEMHVTSTVTNEYPLIYNYIQEYLNRWQTDLAGKVAKPSPNKRIVTTQYYPNNAGRWQILFYLIPTLLGQEVKMVYTNQYNYSDSLDAFAQCLVVLAKDYYPGVNFGWYPILDLEDEEMHYIVEIMLRTDERGRPMHSFNFQIVFWSEK
ncbi:hypothetical protein FACS1894163_02450 [Spirochaetia bacterium]|nr:hypothetical protein FACS1894163_02450 [Spirochaetia bacterium]